MSEALQVRVIQAALGFIGDDVDGIPGPRTVAVFQDLVARVRAGGTVPVSVVMGSKGWKFTARIDGADLVVENCRATCFGGTADPQDSGDTASGISTRDPKVLGVALPMNGKHFTGLNAAEHAALDGSPIPRIPWKTIVRVESGGISHDFPVIDLGPAKRTGNAIDLTIAAARKFKPNATATNFSATVSYRILGGARYVGR
jgi:hypothetical protein